MTLYRCAQCQRETSALHHIFFGADRPAADALGLVIPLCQHCHNWAHGIRDNDNYHYPFEYSQTAIKSHLCRMIGIPFGTAHKLIRSYTDADAVEIKKKVADFIRDNFQV